MEAEIAETRREIRAVERGESTTTFDERDHLESNATTDGARAEMESDVSTDDSSDRSASTSAAAPSPSSPGSDASRDDGSERDEGE